jgi:serine/threonine-protein kinase
LLPIGILLTLLGCGRIHFDPGATDADGGSDARADADGGLPPRTPTISLTAGGDHGCVLAAGDVFCWGANAEGQLGDGTTENSGTPIRVVGLAAASVTQVSAGHSHTCAVSAGDAYCWGSGLSGELGDGAERTSSSPVMVVGLPAGRVTRVDAGRHFSCAVADGQAFCWGDNSSGRLGIGSDAPNATTATRIADWDGGVSYVFAGGDHAVAIVDGAVFTWGHDDSGALGAGADLGESSVPVAVAGLDAGATRASMGGFTGCALVSGAVWCWGTGGVGELGNGETSSSNTPVMVSGMESGVTHMEVSGGPIDGDAACAVRAGALHCWGNGGLGRLGNGSMNPSATPLEVAGLPAPAYASAGGFAHTCAVLENDAVFCWGAGSAGQLGNGEAADSFTPVQVAPVWVP